MSGIFFYSILIIILLSIFVPSIYTYAYKCFIGRVVLVLLIIYFSKHSMLLGLIFVTIIIITSMPLYEGFSGDDIQAKHLLVTSNYSIKDKNNNQEVFNYFTNYYCAKDSNGNVTYPLAPNKDKYNRWYDIFKSNSSDNDSKNVTSTNIMLQSAICNPDTSQYYQNYGNNFQQNIRTGSTTSPAEIDGCTAKAIDENDYCSYWAAIGECSRNPGYMLYRCKASCNRYSGTTSTDTNHVYNFPKCLKGNFKTQLCGNNFIQNVLSSAKNVSDSYNVDDYLNQDGQWMLNMNNQVCSS